MTVRRWTLSELAAHPTGQLPDAFVDSDDHDALRFELDQVREAADSYYRALAVISDNESGIWGKWARQALDDQGYRPSK